ncbi:MAG: hypothetical protein A2038_03185 [Deltaproteobacteria bacterium GWA2_57_13]|nr:MAG: hypothetical protein A2038_03185 [Deltaproteobacteria bacterium GWA2_57_13]OGQ52677.1 MAG: hypothetical protein A3I10_06150 [Deltaproteobacteria bacterium RIFCSPLOWO2_02_FULL_57_26]OGQ84006.1 MAG: hypothetical protein A3G40_10395 [Deltaproteobacteria bacterium RIFCSPLOWO2_12_FULL_57_22]
MRHPSLIRLSHDHHHGLALALRCRKQALGQLKPTGAQGLKQRAEEVRNFVGVNLRPHFQAEEELVFPHMRDLVSESQPLIEELLKEHEWIRDGADRLQESSSLAKLLFDLGDLLERHIRREERELFPLFESRVTPAEAEKLKVEIEKILAGRDRK